MRWNTLRLAVLAGIGGGIVVLCANIARSFGGRISGPALLGVIVMGAVSCASIAAVVSFLRNKMIGA